MRYIGWQKTLAKNGLLRDKCFSIFVQKEQVQDMTDLEYMKLAIQEARKGITNGDGGPFGSVIVKDGVIVGCGHNMVLRNNDATAHGEVSAIRVAGDRLRTHDLSGTVIYTTGEPCPMCLCACMWANIDHIYYGCTIDDNEKIGFRDEKFNDILGIDREFLADKMTQVGRDECLALFDEYLSLQHEIY